MKKVLLTSAAVVAAAAALNAAPVHAYGNWTGWNNGGAGSTDSVNHGDATNVRDHNDPLSLDYNRNSRNPMVKYGFIKYDRTEKAGFTKHLRVTVVDGGGRPVPNALIDVQIIPNAASVYPGTSTARTGESNQYESFTVKTNESGDADFTDFPVLSGDGQVLRDEQGQEVRGSVLFKAGETVKYRVATTATDFKEATDLVGQITITGDMYTNGEIKVPYKLDDRAAQIGNQTSAAQYGWAKTAEGWKYFEKATAVTGWKQVDGNWYYLNDKGVMQTGWVNVNGTWYYLNKSGAMQTGWLKDGDTWYFLESTGAMKASQWFEVSGKWYHVNGSGALSVNTTVDGYNVNANGEWV